MWGGYESAIATFSVYPAAKKTEEKQIILWPRPPSYPYCSAPFVFIIVFISFYFCNVARAKFKQVSINTIIVIDICNTNWIMTDGRRQQIHRTNSGLKSLAPSLNHLYMQISVNYSFTINFTKFQTSFAININYRSMYFLQHWW